MYKAFTENKGDSKHYATTRHSNFVLDTAGNGSNPIDTLLASLCGCMGHFVRDYMIAHQITHNGFNIETEADMTADKTLGKISVRVDLKDVKFNDSQMAEMLKYMENCPVHKS